MLDRVLEYAYEHKAIGAVPTDVIDRSAAHYAVGDDTGFEPHPLSPPQVAAPAAKVGERYEVYELLVLFMAYTGLRAAEVQGLEFRDLILTTGPDGSTRGSVRVQRTKTRRRREWVTGTPKSKTSKRTVPLPGWLAARMADYLAHDHPRERTHRPIVAATAARQSRRQPAAGLVGTVRPQRRAVQDHPTRLGGGRLAREQASADGGRWPGIPATKGVRLHDLRHTAAVSLADRRRALHPGCEVAGAQQLRADPDDIRRLHPRSRDREPATRTCCGGARHRQRGENAPLDGGLDMAACRRSRTIRHPGTTAALSH